MKEIIIAGIGSCGINLSLSYLQLMTQEHSLSTPLINRESEVHFNLKDSSSPESRFILMDTDCYSLDRALSHPQACLIKEDNLLSCDVPSHNLYAYGFYSTKGKDEQILDVFRKEFEKCDSLQAIVLNHSAVGGAGSGLTIRIARMLAEKNKEVFNQMIAPSFHSSIDIYHENALSVYNTVFNFNGIVENCHFSLISDNCAMEKLIEYNHSDRNFDAVNKVASKMLSCLTSGTRFSGIQPASLRKIETNCVTFPRLHIFSGHYFEETRKTEDFMSVSKGSSLKGGNNLFSFPINGQKILSSLNLFRGNDYCSSEIEEIGTKELEGRVYWIANDATGHVNNLSNKNEYREAGFLYCGSFLGQYLKKLSEQFTKIFRRKSFVHWYTSSGMDEMEFVEAESMINDFQYEIDPFLDIVDEQGEYE